MRRYFLLLILLAVTKSANGVELTYPSTAAISCTYEVSEMQLRIGDTIQIVRTLVNNELFDLNGVYLSDNFPESFQIISQQLRINGNPVTAGFEADAIGTISSNYRPYRWLIDDPFGGTVNFTLAPGDSVELTLALVCSDVGQFTLEDHSNIAYGDSASIFTSTDQPIVLIVSISTSVDDEDGLPQEYLTAIAYPNPFNNRATIAYSKPHSGSLKLEIYDLLGRLVYDSHVANAGVDGLLYWEADNVGSGVYLYRLRSKSHSAGGKLMLLK